MIYLKAPHAARELGASASEEFEAYLEAKREAGREAKRVRAEIADAVDSVFFLKGWK